MKQNQSRDFFFFKMEETSTFKCNCKEDIKMDLKRYFKVQEREIQSVEQNPQKGKKKRLLRTYERIKISTKCEEDHFYTVTERIMEK